MRDNWPGTTSVAGAGYGDTGGGTGYVSVANGDDVRYYRNDWGAQPCYIYAQAAPSTCIGRAHVFECDHERTCMCGRVTRVMEKEEVSMITSHANDGGRP